MKKKILGLAFVAMSLIAFNSNAQTDASSGGTTQETVVKSKKDVRKSDNKFDRKDGLRFDKKNRADRMNPFEGINLTEQQQSQLKDLYTKRREARKQEAQTRRENKQANDSTRMAQRRRDRKSYLEEVKAIIGPDNYVIFLENAYLNSAPKDFRKAGAPDRRNHR